MQYFFGFITFVLGAALGSFLNVVADRFNTGMSFLKGRSICFSCGKILKKSDLFPVFSFLFLRGRCRYCNSKISKKLFFSEIIMGTISVVLATKFQIFNFLLPWQLFASFFFLVLAFASILLISIYDIKHFIIPNIFLFAFFILAFLYNLFFYFYLGPKILLIIFLKLIVSGLLLSIPFLLIFLVSRGNWFGLGDVKYIFVIGFFLGFIEGLSAVVLAFWIGATVAIVILALKYLKIRLPSVCNNLTIKSEIPFGPFLSLGIIISFYFNVDLLQIHSLLGIL